MFLLTAERIINPKTVAVHGNPIVSYRTPPTKGPIKALFG